MTNIKRSIFGFSFLLIASSPLCLSQNSFDLTELESGQLLLNLGVTEQIRVEQDTLNASLAYSIQGRDKIALQNDVNEKMATAIGLVDAISEIEYQTGQYYIYIFRPGRPSRNDIDNPVWRAQQSLQLNSRNSEVLLEIVGELQSIGMEISRLDYSLSEEVFAQTSDSLLSIALEKLQTRAAETAELLDKSSATLVEVTINGNRNASLSQSRMAMMESSQNNPAMATPIATPGESEVSLNIAAKALLSP
ncbi:MAG: hypothetical protein CMQ41_14610 [Gammaproteobacteria bacterium]|nr:hypothetical protein [Gammaproteobacteria bacterium]